MEYQVILIDASETPIERLKKKVRNKRRIKNRNNRSSKKKPLTKDEKKENH